MGDGFDLGHLQYPQIGLPLVKPEKGIMVGTEVLGHPRLPANGAIERKRQSNGIYAQASFGAEVKSWWHREGSIASTEAGRKRIS